MPDEEQYECLLCGTKPYCVTGMTLHLLTTHGAGDVCLDPSKHQKCLGCLAGTLVPLSIESLVVSGKKLFRRYVSLGDGQTRAIP